jgi:hypothetical protein
MAMACRIDGKCGDHILQADFPGTNRLSLSHATVAVGTTITDRPPHRSVHARLRIRLLPRMNGVEALVGIRMQNTWVRNPPVEQWVETVPSHLRALAATN